MIREPDKCLFKKDKKFGFSTLKGERESSQVTKELGGTLSLCKEA